MMNSWYTELSGVNFKLGLWWMPEKEEQGFTLYHGYEYAPPGAQQKLTKRQKDLFREGESELRFILDCNEIDGDEPRFTFPLYRSGKKIGILMEYISGNVRVVKRYLYADYGSACAASGACCWDAGFRAFLKKYGA